MPKSVHAVTLEMSGAPDVAACHQIRSDVAGN